MKFINFEPNKPQVFIFPASGPLQSPGGEFSLYPLEGGDLLYLAPSLRDSLAPLKLQAGEEFTIGLYYDRGTPHWVCSLTPGTERARAAAESESEDLQARLSASIRLVQDRKGASSSGASVPVLAPTGTDGIRSPVAVTRKTPALAACSASGRGRGGPIPYNVAFREIVTAVSAELKAAGEQWNDEARQAAVSTLFIAAAKAGWLGVWERGAA